MPRRICNKPMRSQSSRTRSVERLHEIRDAGVTVAGALSPQRTQQYYSTVLNAGVLTCFS